QEWLVYLFDRVRVFADCRADRVQADRTPIELLDDRLQNARVHVVEPEHVDVEQLQRLLRNRLGNHPAGLYLRIVANTTQQTIGDARRPTCATCDLRRTLGIDPDLEHLGGAT